MRASLYAHVPLCLSKCAYCDFFSLSLDRFPDSPGSASASSSVVAALSIEIASRVPEWNVSRWDTVYVGGGTPSLLNPRDVSALCASIRNSVSGDVPEEWTVEANPEDITEEWLDACREAGVNRLSVGVQSLNDRCRVAVGRRGSAATTLAALALARKRWDAAISADLITGLPHQTMVSLGHDIAVLDELGCDHVSLYSLTLEEGTPLYRTVEEGRMSAVPTAMTAAMPTEDEATELWLHGRDELERRGYRQYEVSNFARAGRESAHNRVYWRMGSWIGVGPSAAGNVPDGDRSTRIANATDVEAWLADPAGVQERIGVSRKETVTETIMMGFRLREGLDRKAFVDRFGEDILDLVGETFSRWERKGLAERSPENVYLTRDGLMLLNRFLSECLDEMGD